ncbi:uncharacterized protein LOC118405274 [Branchiostoma floridae]|uniref:Uncharacterized protein LOC118405274 n=1 Tax=Branchiostoma floridae TaxID=7739 RepID=A0A9J7HJ32_BRAFL|nr:uncharacterized protein LOC118405274 [Branchiostoma floridae]
MIGESRIEELGTLDRKPWSCKKDSDDGTPLCRECYYQHTLPEGYHPRHLVERKCKGQYCLSHEGRCIQQYMEVQVRNTAPNAKYPDYWVKIGSGCKCILNKGSMFEQFVR